VNRRGVAALVTVGAVAAAGTANAGTAANRRAAVAAAQAMLRGLRLPGGAQPSAGDPSRSHLLAHPGSRPATPALVDVRQFWVLPGGLQAAMNWIQDHPYPGTSGGMGGGSATPSGTTTLWTGFAFGPRPGILSERELIVTVAHAKGGGTALRADAEAVWVVDRPASERIPAGVTGLTVTLRRPGRPASGPSSVTDGRKVRTVVRLVNRLALFQPGAFACPADLGPRVQLDFLSAAGRAPLAVATADGSGCGLVTFRLRGHRQPALSGGPQLIRELAAMHIKLG
jgi:hypothetical protein